MAPNPCSCNAYLWPRTSTSGTKAYAGFLLPRSVTILWFDPVIDYRENLEFGKMNVRRDPRPIHKLKRK
jgi:hypothetical protein